MSWSSDANKHYEIMLLVLKNKQIADAAVHDLEATIDAVLHKCQVNLPDLIDLC